MPELKPSRRRELIAMGREPIELPADIHFAGHETLQRAKCSGDCPDEDCRCPQTRHHLPQYKRTGTYYHPELAKQRLRVAEDRVKRLQSYKASAVEERDHTVDGAIVKVEQYKRELAIILAGGNPETDIAIASEKPKQKVTEETPKKKNVSKNKKVTKKTDQDDVMSDDELLSRAGAASQSKGDSKLKSN